MEVYDIAIVPFILGIVELFKQIGLPNKFCPVVGVVLGIVIGIVYISPADVTKGILVGASLGLSAVGLYSGTKNTKEIFTK